MQSQFEQQRLKCPPRFSAEKTAQDRAMQQKSPLLQEQWAVCGGSSLIRTGDLRIMIADAVKSCS
jgi:hypothetical protein